MKNIAVFERGGEEYQVARLHMSTQLPQLRLRNALKARADGCQTRQFIQNAVLFNRQNAPGHYTPYGTGSCVVADPIGHVVIPAFPYHLPTRVTDVAKPIDEFIDTRRARQGHDRFHVRDTVKSVE